MASIGSSVGLTNIAKRTGYCSRCHFTVWQGEQLRNNLKTEHLNCNDAVIDGSPRRMSPQYERLLGKVSLKKLKRMLKDSPLNDITGHSPRPAFGGSQKKNKNDK